MRGSATEPCPNVNKDFSKSELKLGYDWLHQFLYAPISTVISLDYISGEGLVYLRVNFRLDCIKIDCLIAEW